MKFTKVPHTCCGHMNTIINREQDIFTDITFAYIFNFLISGENIDLMLYILSCKPAFNFFKVVFNFCGNVER
ncbi:hypothetical protein HMPREF2981_04760 [Rothia sp. HMSC069C01]|nr:hypothetical protein HMPREF2981_04760 [Rothia sp. HMSC069C01]